MTTMTLRQPQHEQLWDAMSRYANDQRQSVENFTGFPFDQWPVATLDAFLRSNADERASLSLFTLNRVIAVRRARAQRES